MSKTEQAAWAATRHSPWQTPSQPRASATPNTRLAYLEFATQASFFSRALKPIRFEGKHWKL